MNPYVIGGLVATALVAGLLFYLYGEGREEKGALKHSNTQMEQSIERKENAVKQRGTIERRNHSADWPSLVDKL